MNRDQIDIGKLKDQGLSSKQIVLITNIALDDNITDNQFELFISDPKNTFSDYDQMNFIYKTLLDYNKENSIDITEDIKAYLLEKDDNIRSEYIKIINKSRDDYSDTIQILHQYYDKNKYGVEGLRLFSYIKKEKDSFSLKELSIIYKYCIEKCLIFSIEGEYNTFDTILKLCNHAKSLKEKSKKKLTTDIISTICTMVFESESKTNKYCHDYFKNLELMVEMYINDTVPYHTISKYLGSKLDTLSLEEVIKTDKSEEELEIGKTVIDKFIYLLKSCPPDYDEWEIDKLFKMRYADRDRLEIIMNPKNSNNRICYFCSDVAGYTECNLKGMDNSSWSTKINSFAIEAIENYFNPIYTDIDIRFFGRNILYCDKHNNEKYVDFIFKNLQNKIPKITSDNWSNREEHYKWTRVILYMLERGDRQRRNNKAIDSKFVDMMDFIITDENLKIQNIDISNLEKAFYDADSRDYNDIYNLLGILYSGYNLSSRKIQSLYKSFVNNANVTNVRDKDKNYFSRKDKGKINYVFGFEFNTLSSIFYRISGNQELVNAISKNITISNIMLFTRLADKLSDEFSYHFSSNEETELMLAILLGLNVEDIEKQVQVVIDTVSCKDAENWRNWWSNPTEKDLKNLGLYELWKPLKDNITNKPISIRKDE